MAQLRIRVSESDLSAARRIFNSPQSQMRRKKVHLSFDEFLDRFRSSEDLTAIAKDLEVTHQAISSLYKNNFAWIFGISARKRHLRRIKAARKGPVFPGFTRTVAVAAAAHGCRARPVRAIGLLEGRRRAYTKQICIDRKICHIGEATKLFQGRYLRVVVTPHTIARAFALIIILRLGMRGDRFFIFPQQLLKKRLGTGKRWKVTQKTLYIPIHPLPQKKSRLAKCEDAWKIFLP